MFNKFNQYTQSFMGQDDLYKNIQNTMQFSTQMILKMNKMTMDSMQYFSNKHSNTMHKNTETFYNTMKDAIFADNLVQMKGHQEKLMHACINENLNNAKEMLNISAKSTSDIIDSIQNFIQDNYAQTTTTTQNRENTTTTKK